MRARKDRLLLALEYMPASLRVQVECSQLLTRNPPCCRDGVAARLSLRKQLAAQLEEVCFYFHGRRVCQLFTLETKQLMARGRIRTVSLADGRSEGGARGMFASILSALLSPLASLSCLSIQRS
jgi:hypothetical protein